MGLLTAAAPVGRGAGDEFAGDAAVGAGPEAGLHGMQDQRLDLDDGATLTRLGAARWRGEDSRAEVDEGTRHPGPGRAHRVQGCRRRQPLSDPPEIDRSAVGKANPPAAAVEIDRSARAPAGQVAFFVVIKGIEAATGHDDLDPLVED